MDKIRTVALYGGAFDPPHRSHLAIIKQLLKIPFINQIWLLPCGDRTDKKLVLPKKERFELLKKLNGNNERVKVSEQQINLSVQLKRMIPTYQLITLLGKKHPECQFHFVVGGDILTSIHTWQECQQLLNNVNFIIFPRKGSDIAKGIMPKKYYMSQYEPEEISSSEVKNILLNEQLSKENKLEKVSPVLDQLTIQTLRQKELL